MRQFVSLSVCVCSECVQCLWLRASGTREYQQSSIRRREKERRRRWRYLYLCGALARKQLAQQRRQRVEASRSRRRGPGCVDGFGRAGIHLRRYLVRKGERFQAAALDQPHDDHLSNRMEQPPISYHNTCTRKQ